MCDTREPRINIPVAQTMCVVRITWVIGPRSRYMCIFNVLHYVCKDGYVRTQSIHRYIYTCIHAYIYINTCVCVCVCIQKKLEQGSYKEAEDFANDVRLVWRNAKTYNRQDSAIYEAAGTCICAYAWVYPCTRALNTIWVDQIKSSRVERLLQSIQLSCVNILHSFLTCYTHRHTRTHRYSVQGLRKEIH